MNIVVQPHRRERLARIMVALSESEHPMSQRELATKFGMSQYAICRDMETLKEMGYIAYAPKSERAIRVLVRFFDQRRYLRVERVSERTKEHVYIAINNALASHIDISSDTDWWDEVIVEMGDAAMGALLAAAPAERGHDETGETE